VEGGTLSILVNDGAGAKALLQAAEVRDVAAQKMRQIAVRG